MILEQQIIGDDREFFDWQQKREKNKKQKIIDAQVQKRAKELKTDAVEMKKI